MGRPRPLGGPLWGRQTKEPLVPKASTPGAGELLLTHAATEVRGPRAAARVEMQGGEKQPEQRPRVMLQAKWVQWT